MALDKICMKMSIFAALVHKKATIQEFFLHTQKINIVTQIL